MDRVNHRYLVVPVILLFLMGGCQRESGSLEPAPISTDPIVFDDAFGKSVDFQAFLGSDYNALTQDPQGGLNGSNAIKINVPSQPSWAGGAFVCSEPRNLSGYNCLTFWARASRPETFDIVGFGNDNTGTSRYMTSWKQVAITTQWKRYIIPIPLPEKLTLERGLFFFADNVGNAPSGYEIWFDEIRFDTLSVISNPRPSIGSKNVTTFVGGEVKVDEVQVTFNVDGIDQTLTCQSGYLTFVSSNDTVATPIEGGVKAVGSGSASITAKLGNVDVEGTITLKVVPTPESAAPTPTFPPENVISLFSNAPGYVNRSVNTWAADWAWASREVADIKIKGDDVKVYTNMTTFVGIDFSSYIIDASEMTHFHMDVWIPEGSLFKVKLVDLGEDGAYGGAPDSEHELAFTPTSDPPLVVREWVSLELPLSRFTRLMSTAHLAQIILSGNAQTIFVDNIYFHK